MELTTYVEDLKLNQIISFMESKNIKMRPASSKLDGVYFEYNEFESFIGLMEDLNVKNVFYDVSYLKESEIDDGLITDSDLRGIEKMILRQIAKEDIEEFNEEVEKLRSFVGSLKDIGMFYIHEGTIYEYFTLNVDIYPDDKKDFIEELYEEYQVKIYSLKHENDKKIVKRYEEDKEKLRNFLLQDKEFEKCTNRGSRQAFYYEFKNKIGIESTDLPQTVMLEVVENTWKTLQLNKKLQKGTS